MSSTCRITSYRPCCPRRFSMGIKPGSPDETAGRLAPIPAIRGTAIEPPDSTRSGSLIYRRFVPTDCRAQVQPNGSLFDHLFGSDEHRCWNCEAERLRGFCVDDQFK